MKTKRFLFNFLILFINYGAFLLLSIQHVSNTDVLRNIALIVTYGCCVGGSHFMFQFTNLTFGSSALYALTKHNLVYTGNRKTFIRYGLFYFLYLKLTRNYLNLYTTITNESKGGKQ